MGEGREEGRDGARIRVLLADDHTMFRQGLTEMLATDEGIEVVGAAENGAKAVAMAKETRPDVVILDVEMPVMGAEEAMGRMLREIWPPPRVVIVTMYDDPRLVRVLLGLGASAYLVKSASLDELLAAVHTAYESPMSPHRENVVMVVSRNIMGNPDEGADGLSTREMEVLLLAARGLSNRQISASLHLSEATIKRHLANIYPKMDVGSRTEATSKALRAGWISARDLRDDRGTPGG